MSDPTSPEATTETIEPVPQVPPEQEQQTMNPNQLGQVATHDQPPNQGVTQEEAIAGKTKEKDAPEVTEGTTLGELIENAFFVPEGGTEPEISSVSPTVISFHYPDDGSMIVIRLEARQGAWGGVSAINLSDSGRKSAQDHFDKQRKILEEKKRIQKEAAQAESHDDATARRESKPEGVEEPAHA